MMICPMLPANEGSEPGFYQIDIPAALEDTEPMTIVVCLHLSVTQLDDGVICPICGAIYRDCYWKLEGSARFSDYDPSVGQVRMTIHHQ